GSSNFQPLIPEDNTNHSLLIAASTSPLRRHNNQSCDFTTSIAPLPWFGKKTWKRYLKPGSASLYQAIFGGTNQVYLLDLPNLGVPKFSPGCSYNNIRILYDNYMNQHTDL